MTTAELMDAIEALLNLDIPDGVAVHRQALNPLEKDRLPAIVPYLMGMKPKPNQDTGDDIREYDAEIRIECRALGEHGQTMETSLWPMMYHVQRTMLAPPPLLDGWAMGVEETYIQFDAFQKDRTYCAAALDYCVRIAYSLGFDKETPLLAQISYESPENNPFEVTND